ncbi:MAG: hypothetical protein QXK71_05655 [Pyrobaculum sp.]
MIDRRGAAADLSVILTTALFYLSYEAPRYVDEIAFSPTSPPSLE